MCSKGRFSLNRPVQPNSSHLRNFTYSLLSLLVQWQHKILLRFSFTLSSWGWATWPWWSTRENWQKQTDYSVGGMSRKCAPNRRVLRCKAARPSWGLNQRLHDGASAACPDLFEWSKCFCRVKQRWGGERRLDEETICPPARYLRESSSLLIVQSEIRWPLIGGVKVGVLQQCFDFSMPAVKCDN